MSGSWRATISRTAVRWGILGLWLSAGCSPAAEPPPATPPEALIAEALALAPDPAAGRIVFRAWCIFCHGDQQAGEPPTDFDLGTENPRRFRGYQELTFEEHVAVIVNGYVSKESGNRNMPSFALRLTPREIADVAAYERKVMAMSGPYWEENRRSWQKGHKPEE